MIIIYRIKIGKIQLASYKLARAKRRKEFEVY